MEKRNFDILFPDERHNLSEESILIQAQYVMLRISKVIATIFEDNNIPYWLIGGTLLGAVRHKGFIPWDDDMDLGILQEDYDRAVEVLKKNLPQDLFLQTLETDPEYDLTWIKVKDNNSIIKEYKPGNYHKGIFVDIFPIQRVVNDEEAVLRERNKMKKLHRILSSVKEPFDHITSPKMLVKNIFKLGIKTALFPMLFFSKAKINKILRDSCDKHSKKMEDKNSGRLNYYIGTGFFDVPMDESMMFPLKKIPFADFEFYAPGEYDRYLTTQFGDYMQLPPESERCSHNLNIIPDLKRHNLKDK